MKGYSVNDTLDTMDTQDKPDTLGIVVKSIELTPEFCNLCNLCGNKLSRKGDTIDNTSTYSECYDCKARLMFIINNSKREYCRITLDSFDICKFLDILRNDCWKITDDITQCFGNLDFSYCDYTCKYFG